jgi:hypothetical protein
MKILKPTLLVRHRESILPLLSTPFEEIEESNYPPPESRMVKDNISDIQETLGSIVTL